MDSPESPAPLASLERTVCLGCRVWQEGPASPDPRGLPVLLVRPEDRGVMASLDLRGSGATAASQAPLASLVPRASRALPVPWVYAGMRDSVAPGVCLVTQCRCACTLCCEMFEDTLLWRCCLGLRTKPGQVQ